MVADPLSTTLYALSDPTRRGLLARLARGDATVKELAAPYTMSMAAISKHLKVLESAGLVSRGRAAQMRPVHLEAAPMADVVAWLEEYRRFWDRSLDKLAEYLQQLPKPAPAEAATRAPAKARATRKPAPKKPKRSAPRH